MKTLIVMVGLPRSGKSTWAQESGFPVVSSDEIREETGKTNVWPEVLDAIRELFLEHDTIVLDATNIDRQHRQRWIDAGKREWECSFKVIDTSVHECVRRAKLTNQDYLIPAIYSMNKKFEPLGEGEKGWGVPN